MSAKFQIGLNDRERARFAGLARSVQDQAGKLADALSKGDDITMAVEFMVFSLAVSSLKEVQEIILNAAKRAKSENAYLTPDESAARL